MLLRSDISMVEETGPECSEDYYHQLETQCYEDTFWSRDSGQLPEQAARCQHCRHWIGQSDVGQHVQHVLNGCKTFLQQGRYDWRHAAVLNYVASCMKAGDPEGLRWHCDLPGFRTHDGGTVPDQLVQTELRPDICILDQRKERPSVILIEVTITWDGRLDAARQEKNVKYSELMAKISKQFPVQFVSLEVGSYRQKLSDSSSWSLKTLYNFTAQLVPFETFEENILRITELCSFRIFAERLNSHWDSNTPFPVPPAYIPPEPILPPETDSNQNGNASELDQNVSEPVYSTSEEDSLSPELTRKMSEADEESLLRFTPDSDQSGFSDPRFPEPKPNIFPEPSGLLAEPVLTKPDIIQVSEPAVKADIEEMKTLETVKPEFQCSDQSASVSKPHEEVFKQDEVVKPFEVLRTEEKLTPTAFSLTTAQQSTRTSRIEKSSSFPFLELFIFLLIFFTIVGALFLVWENLHIFMPLFILAYAILKYFGKA